jgi:hypothetical protein
MMLLIIIKLIEFYTEQRIFKNNDNNKITKLDIAIWENSVPGTNRRASVFLIKM